METAHRDHARFLFYPPSCGHSRYLPPLLTKPPTFDIKEDLSKQVAPVFTFTWPEATEACFPIPDSWYYGSGGFNFLPIYLDVFKSRKGDIGRYRLDIISNVSLIPIPRAPIQPLTLRPQQYDQMTTYRICEARSVNFFFLL